MMHSIKRASEGTGRFGKDVSAKKNSRRFGKFFVPKRPVLSWTRIILVVKGDAHQKILRGRGGSREPSTFYQFLPSGLRSILTDLEIHP